MNSSERLQLAGLFMEKSAGPVDLGARTKDKGEDLWEGATENFKENVGPAVRDFSREVYSELEKGEKGHAFLDRYLNTANRLATGLGGAASLATGNPKYMDSVSKYTKPVKNLFDKERAHNQAKMDAVEELWKSVPAWQQWMEKSKNPLEAARNLNSAPLDSAESIYKHMRNWGDGYAKLPEASPGAIRRSIESVPGKIDELSKRVLPGGRSWSEVKETPTGRFARSLFSDYMKNVNRSRQK